MFWLVLSTLPILVDSARTGKNYEKLSSIDYYHDLGDLVYSHIDGGVIAFIDNKANDYPAIEKAFNRKAAAMLLRCMAREQVRVLHTREDDRATAIAYRFHEDQSAARAAVATPFLRKLQQRIDVPFVAHFQLEHRIPQPVSWLAGKLVWNSSTLKAWATSVCDTDANRERHAAYGEVMPNDVVSPSTIGAVDDEAHSRQARKKKERKIGERRERVAIDAVGSLTEAAAVEAGRRGS